MNADEKRKVFEELLEEYQNHIESEFSYEDGEREAERKAWLNRYDGIKEPLVENERARKTVRAWAECCHIQVVHHYLCDGNSCFMFTDEGGNDCCLDFTFRIDNLESNTNYTITGLCGEDEE